MRSKVLCQTFKMRDDIKDAVLMGQQLTVYANSYVKAVENMLVHMRGFAPIGAFMEIGPYALDEKLIPANTSASYSTRYDWREVTVQAIVYFPDPPPPVTYKIQPGNPLRRDESI